MVSREATRAAYLWQHRLWSRVELRGYLSRTGGGHDWRGAARGPFRCLWPIRRCDAATAREQAAWDGCARSGRNQSRARIVVVGPGWSACTLTRSHMPVVEWLVVRASGAAMAIDELSNADLLARIATHWLRERIDP